MSAQVTVLDVNDHAPEFVQTTFRAAVSETAAVGQSVLTVTAVDVDAGENAAVHYRLAHAAQTDRFRVDAASGTVYVAAELDFETATELAFDVVAADGGILCQYQSERLIVTTDDYGHCRRSMRSRVCLTVGRPSVCPPVPSFDRSSGIWWICY